MTMREHFEEFSDEELMILTREGNAEAFETLVHRHHTRLAMYIATVLGNAESAEDLTQETFLRAFRARARYVPKARWTTWVRKIAQNLSRDERRRRAYERICSLDESLVNAPDAIPLRDSIPDPNFVSPDAAICEQETLEELREQIEALSPKHAQVLRMRVYEEMNYQEIADTLGCSLGTVKSRIHYAIRELRIRLGDNHQSPGNDGLYESSLASGVSAESSWPQV